jgi:hypothetical protein
MLLSFLQIKKNKEELLFYQKNTQEKKKLLEDGINGKFNYFGKHGVKNL